MRICVIGAHGTGKSTISKALSEHFNCALIPDVCSDAFHKKFTINEDTPPETQFWIMSKQIELERNTPEPWVMEKSLWDNIIYGVFSIKDKKVIDVITNIVKANAKYDFVFYCPIEFPIPDDGIRSLNIDFQKAIDTSFLSFLKENNIKYHVLSGDIPSRLQQALEIIGKNIEPQKPVTQYKRRTLTDNF